MIPMCFFEGEKGKNGVLEVGIMKRDFVPLWPTMNPEIFFEFGLGNCLMAIKVGRKSINIKHVEALIRTFFVVEYFFLK